MRYSLSTDDVILRGCEKEPPARLLASMRAHFRHPQGRGEWGLSVATMPGADEHAIAKAARQLRQSHYRVASIRDLHALAGELVGMSDEQWDATNWLTVMWDHNAHGLIVARWEPTMELAAKIAAVFGAPCVNPYYEQRRRPHAGR